MTRLELEAKTLAELNAALAAAPRTTKTLSLELKKSLNMADVCTSLAQALPELRTLIVEFLKPEHVGDIQRLLPHLEEVLVDEMWFEPHHRDMFEAAMAWSVLKVDDITMMLTMATLPMWDTLFKRTPAVTNLTISKIKKDLLPWVKKSPRSAVVEAVSRFYKSLARFSALESLNFSLQTKEQLDLMDIDTEDVILCETVNAMYFIPHACHARTFSMSTIGCGSKCGKKLCKLAVGRLAAWSNLKSLTLDSNLGLVPMNSLVLARSCSRLKELEFYNIWLDLDITEKLSTIIQQSSSIKKVFLFLMDYESQQQEDNIDAMLRTLATAAETSRCKTVITVAPLINVRPSFNSFAMRFVGRDTN